jgi:hypothetical protein
MCPYFISRKYLTFPSSLSILTMYGLYCFQRQKLGSSESFGRQNSDYLMPGRTIRLTPQLSATPSRFFKKMPSSSIVHAAVFTAGALLGGGIAAAVSRSQRPGQAIPLPGQVRTPAPVIDVDATGRTTVSSSIIPKSDLPPVLKYGHPGMLYGYFSRWSKFDAVQYLFRTYL